MAWRLGRGRRRVLSEATRSPPLAGWWLQRKFHKRAAHPRDLSRWELRLRLCHDHPSWAVRLWAAALSDAIRVARTSRSRLRRAEVRAWVGDTAADYTTFGTFNWLCAELDLDTEYVRRDILALRSD